MRNKRLILILAALVVIILAILPYLSAYATNTSATSPSTMATSNANGGVRDWTNPNNAKASEDSYATARAGDEEDELTYYLKASNFGFAIPAGATINGVIVEFERKSSASTSTIHCHDARISLIKADGTIGATSKADTVTRWSTTEAYFSYGANNDLWGLSLAEADI